MKTNHQSFSLLCCTCLSAPQFGLWLGSVPNARTCWTKRDTSLHCYRYNDELRQEIQKLSADLHKYKQAAKVVKVDASNQVCEQDLRAPATTPPSASAQPLLPDWASASAANQVPGYNRETKRRRLGFVGVDFLSRRASERERFI